MKPNHNSITNSAIGNRLKLIIGRIIVMLQPSKAQQLLEDGITLVLSTTSPKERLMRIAILKKLEMARNYDLLARMHRNYWTHYGAKFFSETEGAFRQDFLPNCNPIFDELKNVIEHASKPFNKIVEIGTGKGEVLHYLNNRFPTLDKFIGLDLSLEQIRMNKEIYKKQPKMEFINMDVRNWINQNNASGTIFVTFGGVLEYFTEQQLQTFFYKLNTSGKTIFMAFEPNDPNHDFEANPSSQLYGYEKSFSHNYAKLFSDAGFSIWHMSQTHSNYGPHLLHIIGVKN